MISIPTNKENRFISCVLFFSLFFYVLIGNGLTFSLFGGINIKGNEILLFASSILVHIYNFSNKNKSLKTNKDFTSYLLIWLLYSASVSIFSSLLYFGSNFLLKALFYPLRLLAYLYVIYQYKVYLFSIDIQKAFPKIKKILVIAFFLTAVIGVFQFFLFPSALEFYKLFERINVYWDGDPHYNRLFGLYFDPNYFAAILIIPVALIIGDLKSSKEKNYGLLLKLLLVFFIVVIFLTKSRSGFLGLIIFLVLNSFHLTKRNILSTLALVFAILLFFSIFPFTNIGIAQRLREGLSDKSSQARFTSWFNGLKVFFENPLFGIGFNMIPAYNQTNSILYSGAGTNSSLIQILMCSGIIGAIILLIPLIKFFKKKTISFEFKSLMFVALVICNFNELLFNPLWFLPFILLISVEEIANIEVKKRNVFSLVLKYV